MAFTTTIILGAVGSNITNVKLQECTGNNVGCTNITGYTSVAVSSFPLEITTISDTTTYIKVISLGTCTTNKLLLITGVIPPVAGTNFEFNVQLNQGFQQPYTYEMEFDTAYASSYNALWNWGVGLSVQVNSGVSSIQRSIDAGFPNPSSLSGYVTPTTTNGFPGFKIVSGGMGPGPGGSGTYEIDDITQWGNNKWKYLNFSNADDNLTISDTAYPDLSACVDLSSCFSGLSGFNDSNIISWNTSNVTDMSSMFSGASSFNQDISSWDVGNVTTMNGIFSNSGMSSTNYGLFLKRCYALATTTGVQSSVALGAGTIQYPASAATARNYLTGTKGWTITDGGQV